MKSTLRLLFASIALTTASANPFVGENMNASSVRREDGGFSMKMTKKQVGKTINKYSTMVDHSKKSGPQLSMYEQAVEQIYGKSLDKQIFERKTESLLASKSQEYRKEKRLGDSHVGSTLKTDDGFMWTGTIYMGRFSPMDVVFDTGSDWLVIESHLCDSCEGNTYDTSESPVIGTEESYRWYGSAQLYGIEHEDTVCVLLNECVENFEYFAIYTQEGITEPIDGILGLARPNQFYYSAYYDTETYEPGQLYLQAMYNQGLIDERTVSFYFDQLQTSYADFGQPQESAMSNIDDLVYFDMTDNDFFWSTYNQAVGIGSTQSSSVYGYGDSGDKYAETLNNNSIYTIFDTGLSAMMISGAYFEDLITRIFKYMGATNYRIENGYVLCDCYSDFPPLYFMFE